MRVLVFELDARRYGVEASAVLEVLPAALITPLAGSPAAVEGMLNVRGSVVRVISARVCLGVPPAAMRHTDHLIVAAIDGASYALHVDRAVDLLELDDAVIEKVGGEPTTATYKPSVARLDDGLLEIHNLSTLLVMSMAVAGTGQGTTPPAAVAG